MHRQKFAQLLAVHFLSVFRNATILEWSVVTYAMHLPAYRLLLQKKKKNFFQINVFLVDIYFSMCYNFVVD